MLHDILHGIIDWMTAWASTPYSAWALFLIAFAESSFFPIPPDVLLIACGILNPSTAILFAAICTVGSALGGGFGYLIGLYGGRPILNRFIAQDKLNAIDAYYQKYGVWAVGIAGFTPIPYKLFTVTAGAFRLNFWSFLLVSFVSRGARFFLVGAIIAVLGETAETYLKEYLDIIVISFSVLLIGGFVVLKFLFKSKSKQSISQK